MSSGHVFDHYTFNAKASRMGVDHRQNLQPEIFAKQLSSNVCPPTALHMLILTRNKYISLPLDSNFTSIIFVCTIPVKQRYSVGCTCATCLDYVVSHCRHYPMEFRRSQGNQADIFAKKFSFNALPPIDSRMVKLTENK